MDYLLDEKKAIAMQDKLEKIGALSLLIIKRQEKISKDDIWEQAVEINKAGQELYKDLARLNPR